MREMSSTWLRVTVLGSVVVAGALMGVLGHGLGATMSAEQAPQSNFMGGNPTQLDAKAIRTLRQSPDSAVALDRSSYGSGSSSSSSSPVSYGSERGSSSEPSMPSERDE